MKKATVLIGTLWIVGLGVITLFQACTSDQLPEPEMSDCGTEMPTYTNDIKPIIDANCAYSGCHLDSAPGQYDTYAGITPNIENNRFRQRVIIERADPVSGMPPSYAPEGRSQDLTDAELALIECWLDAGYPE